MSLSGSERSLLHPTDPPQLLSVCGPWGEPLFRLRVRLGFPPCQKETPSDPSCLPSAFSRPSGLSCLCVCFAWPSHGSCEGAEGGKTLLWLGTGLLHGSVDILVSSGCHHKCREAEWLKQTLLSSSGNVMSGITVSPNSVSGEA